MGEQFEECLESCPVNSWMFTLLESFGAGEHCNHLVDCTVPIILLLFANPFTLILNVPPSPPIKNLGAVSIIII
jgi:accessory gene regulator protein AgrB